MMYKSMSTNLMVEDVERSASFYEGVLGFSVVDSVKGPDDNLIFAILVKGQLMLMLQEKQSFTAEYPILATNKIKPSISLYIIVDDFDTLYEDIKSKHAIYSEVHVTPYGAKEFAITDIDGYVLTFAENQDR